MSRVLYAVMEKARTGSAGGGPTTPGRGRTLALTVLALVAFAANSVLCRLALVDGRIDAVTFTIVRLAAGAAVLVALAAATGARWRLLDGRGGFWLFAYATGFSIAYVDLSTGTGALLLFGAVQLTMMIAGLAAGERLRPLEWGGFVAAAAGLVYLVRPGLAAPPWPAALAMAAAGVAWGVYSLRGRRSADEGGRGPTAATAGNFVAALPWCLPLWLTLRPDAAAVSGSGVALAVISGAVTSGLGYVIWYAALEGLSATRAAIAQLTVPLLAAAGGVALLGESISLRLLLAAVLILGGVATALRDASVHRR